MLLAGQRSDPGDAFNQFWTIMQGMLDNLSQPVAFATIPLGDNELYTNPNLGIKSLLPSRQESSLGNNIDVDEPILTRLTKRIGIDRGIRKAGRGSVPDSSPWNDDENLDEGISDEGDELSESFYLIPSDKEPPPADLKQQNTSLKLEVEAMRKRLETTERILQLRKGQDLQLRDSIFQATREAQRVMGASMVAQRPGGLDLNSLNINLPPAVAMPGMNSSREAQYARRVKELEEELRTLRAENEKHKAMLAKYHERWEKLKESAKRKKEAKAVAEAVLTGVREKIVEEPDMEEEMDRGGAQ